jgi:hypothetical protein
MSKRRRSAGVVLEGLEGRRLLAGQALAAGWEIAGISLESAEVRAGEELRLDRLDVKSPMGGSAAGHLNASIALSRDAVAGNDDDVVVGWTGWVVEGGIAQVSADYTFRAFRLASDMPTGMYRVVVTLSGADGEAVDSAVGPEVHVSEGGLPDLTVGHFESWGLASSSTVVAGTKTLIGLSPDTTEMTSRTVDVRVSMSPDDVAGNGDDVVLGNFSWAINKDPRLAVCFQSLSVTIPDWVAPGTYHLVAVVDPENKVAESDETNNAVVGQVLMVELPAWSIPGIGLGAGEVRAGGKLVVEDVTFARGEGAGAGVTGLVVDIALSRDGVVGNEDDLELGGQLLPAVAGVADVSGAWSVQGTTEPGTYHLVARLFGTDGAGGARVEYGRFVGPAVEVLPAGPVDLEVGPVVVAEVMTPGPFAAGGMIAVAISSTTTEYAHRAVDVRYALSSDDVVGNEDDIVLGVLPTIAEGDASPSVCLGVQWLTIAKGIAPGAYRLVAVIDPANEVAEADETNNAVVGPVVRVVDAGEVGRVVTPATPVTPVAPIAPAASAVPLGEAATLEKMATDVTRQAPAARLVAKLVSVRRGGKLVRVLRVTNVGDGGYRAVATVRVEGLGVVKRKLSLRAGQHVDIAVKVPAVKQKGIRVSVRQ